MNLVNFFSFYKRVRTGQALVRTGFGGLHVSFDGITVIPFLHLYETMDISLQRVEIERTGKNGLICKDNMRADIKVAFFVQVNRTKEDVLRVAQSVGCERASELEKLSELFDAKFSEALKTVGKHFDFVELYNSRERFKEEILKIIGRDLNGYFLDDAAIDYLEQTPKDIMSIDNILDAEGIKKITQITAHEAIQSNNIEKEKEKTITKQNVEAEEAILQLNRQLEEKKAIQQREIASIRAREDAETKKVQAEERQKYEIARIAADEEIEVAQQNKERQVIVAMRSKEGTDAVETERVTRVRDLEINERERIVTIAQIEKEKAVEGQKKEIQDIIRERVIVEKAVVVEEEAIKTTRAKAQADREKMVAVTKAQEEAEESLIVEVKKAEAQSMAADLHAKRLIVESDAEQQASSKRAEAMKTLADAKAAEHAVVGLSEANVMQAKALAHQKEGEAQAVIVERMAAAEAKGIEVKAEAKRLDGAADAEVLRVKLEEEAKGMIARAAAHAKEGEVDASIMAQRYSAEAEGISQKADAMKKMDGVGQGHEEFKLRLAKEKEVELAEIGIRVDIAKAQADVLSEALKSAKIDIVGGEPQFFERIAGAITQGKAVDRIVDNSEVLTQARHALLGSDGENLAKLRDLAAKSGVTTADVRDMTISALLLQMMAKSDNSEFKDSITDLLSLVTQRGLANKPAAPFLQN
jgi:uncharacterized membrane protein YqiK